MKTLIYYDNFKQLHPQTQRLLQAFICSSSDLNKDIIHYFYTKNNVFFNRIDLLPYYTYSKPTYSALFTSSLVLCLQYILQECETQSIL